MTLASHLLQSTVFAVVAGLATLALQKNHARTRHWLWLAASVKFLVPFSLLIALGSHVELATPARTAPPQLAIVMEDVGLPAEPLPYTPAAPSRGWTLNPLLALWIAGASALCLRWWMRWRRVAAIVHDARPMGEVSGIPLLSSGSAVEPGVFGIFRPKLLLPAGITAHLSDGQLEAVMAHEMCHVRHRDNLAAAIHMLVETLFWFHPLVWWIGARLADERERACDEEVVGCGSDPELYAGGILTVCRLCLEAPLPCVSGIKGADLQRRIESIMMPRAVRRLDFGRKLLLACVGISAVTAGLWHASRAQAQERAVAPLAFEVASVKLLPAPKNWPWPEGFATVPKRSGGRITWVTSTRALLFYAYRVQRWQAQLPAGMHDSFYAIDAKTAEAAKDEQIRLMFQTLLKDRFHLAVHRERKEINGYALTLAKGHPKMKEFKDTDEPPAMPEYFSTKPVGAFEHRVIISAEGELSALTGRRVSMDQLAEGLEEEVQTFVLNETGMPGSYYFGTKFASERNSREADGPSLFTALQESLGLKLEKQRGPVEMLIVEHIETVPTDN